MKADYEIRQETEKDYPQVFKLVEEGRRSGDPAVLIASSAKCKKALGWNPTRSSTEEIIAAAWKWHLSHPYGYGGEKQKESL